MKTFLVIVATVFAAMLAACGGEEEVTSSTFTPQINPTPAVVVNSTFVEPTSEANQVPLESTTTPTIPDPTPIATPDPTPEPETDFGEPTAEDVQTANEIFETVKPLPEAGTFRITHDSLNSGSPGGVFQVWILAADTEPTYIDSVQQAQEWFRSKGFEPCERPLDRTIVYMLEVPVTPGYSYEPCSDYN